MTATIREVEQHARRYLRDTGDGAAGVVLRVLPPPPGKMAYLIELERPSATPGPSLLLEVLPVAETGIARVRRLR